MGFWFKRLWKSPIGLIGVIIVIAVVFAAVFAPFLAPFDPNQSNRPNRLKPPGTPGNLLGTDQQGRDMLSRIIYGARISLLVSFVTVISAVTIGTLIGLLAGYYGGIIDTLFMRVVDVWLSFPFILLALTVNALLGIGLRNIIITLIVTGWVVYARLVRGEVLALKEQQFIEATRALGQSDLSILFSHLLPNVITPIIVVASLQVSQIIVAEATISFLGFGIQPPTAAWGNMLSEGRNYLINAWWLATFPGVALAITALGINLTGDWLRDTLDPKID